MNSPFTSSGDFIDDSSVACSRKSDPSDDTTRLIESFSAHHDHVDGVRDSIQSRAKARRFLANVVYLRLEYEEIDVAVRGHRSCGGGTEQNHAVRTANAQKPLNDFLNRLVTDGDALDLSLIHISEPTRLG